MYNMLIFTKIRGVNMKIFIADINPSFIAHVIQAKENQAFKHLDNFNAFHGSFSELGEPNANVCMVGAGNSFGSLTGGVDLAIRKYFGKQIEQVLQQAIIDKFLGELPVGSSMVIPTQNEDIKFLAYAPTMRTPKVIAGTDIPYVATWSALTTIHRINQTLEKPIDTVVFPGMGTGTGQIELNKAALQMVYAIDNYFKALNSPAEFINMKTGLQIELNLHGLL